MTTAIAAKSASRSGNAAWPNSLATNFKWQSPERHAQAPYLLHAAVGPRHIKTNFAGRIR